MRIDCHLHTACHSACSSIDPRQACALALERGLDALVITEHYRQWPADDLARLQAVAAPLRVFSGFEATVAEGYDIVVLAEGKDLSAPPGIPFDALLRSLDAHAGARFLILAHSFRWSDRTTPQLERLLARVHGLEMISVNILGNHLLRGARPFRPDNWELYRSARERHGLVPLYNSDAHSEEMVGSVANELPGEPPRDMADLVERLRTSTPGEFQSESRLVRLENRL